MFIFIIVIVFLIILVIWLLTELIKMTDITEEFLNNIKENKKEKNEFYEDDDLF